MTQTTPVAEAMTLEMAKTLHGELWGFGRQKMFPDAVGLEINCIKNYLDKAYQEGRRDGRNS